MSEAVDADVTAPEEEQPAPQRSSRDRTLVRALGILAVVFFVGALVLALVAATVYNDLQHERGDRDDVERAAATFAARLLTFDHRELDELRKSVEAMSTASFRREYGRAFPGLEELIKAGETVSEGTVTDLYVGNVGDDSATAIAVVKTTTTGRAGRRTGDFYMELDLAKSGGEWRIDGFTNLNFSRGGIAGTAATTTTTTPGG